MVTVRVEKRDAWFLSVIVVLLVGVGVVFAYNSGGPASLMGHSAEELEVDIDDDGVLDKTLQGAIDDGDLGSGGGSGLDCTTFEFDGSDAPSWRYFKFTLPYECKQIDQGGNGCSWKKLSVNPINGQTIPDYGELFIQYEGTVYSNYMGILQMNHDVNIPLSLKSYNIADGISNNLFYDSMCVITDFYFDGTWKNDEGAPYNVLGVTLFPGRKCYFQICDLGSVTDLTSGEVVFG